MVSDIVGLFVGCLLGDCIGVVDGCSSSGGLLARKCTRRTGCDAGVKEDADMNVVGMRIYLIADFDSKVESCVIKVRVVKRGGSANADGQTSF